MSPVRVTQQILVGWPLPSGEGDKDSRGKVLIVAGGAACPGAALLAAEAALRSGAGKVQVATSGSLAAAVGLAIPESRTIGLPENENGEISGETNAVLLETAARADAVLSQAAFTSVDDAEVLAEAPE